MPPITKYTKDDIINVSYKIVKKTGLDSLNAREIAKRLNSSIAPVFHNFKTMDVLKKEVINKIHDTYMSYMKKGSLDEKSYRGMGLYYIKFARDYPEFFKILFMSESKLSPADFIPNDDSGNSIIESGQIFSGLIKEKQQQFHLKVWIFTHGLACLASTKTVKFTDEEIEELLTNTTREMLIGFKKENL